MAAEQCEMQIVTRIYFTQRILMQLTEMICLSECIVRELPVKVHGDGFRPAMHQVS